MNYVEREQFIQVHEDDAKIAGVNEGDIVQITGDDGHVLARGTAVFESPQVGLVGSTTLFGELATKMHELEAADWTPQMPGLGYSTVIIESVPAGQEAGVAAD
jgi:predicted molibdopterin-dependent oxidoreductase YjgC